MMDLSSVKIQPLNETNYYVWSMKIEALLEAKQLYEDVIENDEPVENINDKNYAEKYSKWKRKNKEALGIIILSLSDEQAIVYRGIKKAKDVWIAIKNRYEGILEDTKLDLTLELTKLSKSNRETMEEYLTRAQKISHQLTELGKQITERELVRYIVEGLPENYDSIVTALSVNRSISFMDLRQTLLHFERKETEIEYETKAFKVSDKRRIVNRQKLCFLCNKRGHFERECWFNNKNKRIEENYRKRNFRNKNNSDNDLKKIDISKSNKEYSTFFIETDRNETAEVESNKIENAMAIKEKFGDQEEHKIIETSDEFFEEEKNGLKPGVKENQPKYFYKNEKNLSENNITEIQYEDPDTMKQSLEEEQEEISDLEDEENSSSTKIDDPSQSTTDQGRLKRDITFPKKFDDDYVYLTSTETPQTFQEAMQSADKIKWKEAMDKEIQSLISYNVWKSVTRPKNTKIIKSKWVYKIKNDENEEKFKARLVAVGFNQKQGIDFEENFSPVMKWDSFRILIALAAQKNSVIKHFDVNTAYLNGDLNETVYMEPPPGYNTDQEKVYLLKKSIYGLPQSGRCWYLKFKEILESIGLQPTKADPCIYVKQERNSYIYLGVYVDDFLVIADSEETITNFINTLKTKINLKETTKSNMFLSTKIVKNGNNITLSQKEYLHRILNKYNLNDCKPVKTPGTQDQKLDVYEDSKKISVTEYREAIGSLMYLAVGTRPDIAFAISNLSQYCNEPREIHWTAVKRVLRYLKGTENKCLIFKKSDEEINITSDASWSTTRDAKSFGGYTVQFGTSLISWKSSKQKLVALSTMEAELISVCDALSCGMWIKALLEDITGGTHKMKISTDSEALINWIKNPKVSARTRHINRKYYFIKDEFEKENFDLKYKNTKDLEADILTKNVNAETLSKHIENLCIRDNT